MTARQRGYMLAPLSVFAALFGTPNLFAQVQFSSQGIVYSARAGGDEVAVDGYGNAYVVEMGQCPTAPGQVPGIFEGYVTGGRWLVKLDRNARHVVYRRLLGCDAGIVNLTNQLSLLGVDERGYAYLVGVVDDASVVPIADFSGGGTAPFNMLVKLDPSGQTAYAVKLAALPFVVAFDAAGNAYFTGQASAGFPTTPGAFQTSCGDDAFVFTLDPTGTRMLYSTCLGGSSSDYPQRISVDLDGNAYVLGGTSSVDFPTSPGALDEAGGQSFVAKLNHGGSALVYSARLHTEGPRAFAVNGVGEAYLAGERSRDLGPFGLWPDVWLMKLDASGGSVLYRRFIAGTGDDRLGALGVDAAGDAYVVGVTSETGAFPVTARSVQAGPQGNTDAFVTVIDNAGQIRYSTRLGSTAGEWWTAAAVDRAGDVYVTGYSMVRGSAYDPLWASDFPVSPGTVATAPAVQIEADTGRGFLIKLVPRPSRAQSATASSVEAPWLAPANAIDGNPVTRWSSAFADGESLLLDLGVRTVIDRIVLNWETAYADSYEIRVADVDVLADDTRWTLAYSTTTGDGAVDDVSGLSVVGRYVWLVGRHRATAWGYSLWDMAVYGTPGGPGARPPTVTLTAPLDQALFVGSSVSVDVAADAADADGSVRLVEFFVDGTVAATDSVPPFAARVPLAPGTYTITAVAVDADGLRSETWAGARVSVYPANLALGRPAAASSVEAPELGPANAVDGNMATRWSSQFSDQQGLTIDLGAETVVDTVVLHWEAAYPASFHIAFSSDGRSYSGGPTMSGSPGMQVVSGLNRRARYIKVSGSHRATPWGYSLWEVEIYGPPSSDAPRNVSAFKPTVSSSNESVSLSPARAVDTRMDTRWSSAWAENQWIFVDLFYRHLIDRIMLRWETAYPTRYLVQISDDSTTWRTVRTVHSDGGDDDLPGISESARYVRIYGVERATPWGISLWEFDVYGTPTGAPNIAASQPVVASSVESDTLSQWAAVDGNGATRWSSQWTDDQWFYVDLRIAYVIDRIVLNWETAYPSQYLVQVSDDAATWRTIRTVDSAGGTDDLRSIGESGRYVRIYGVQRATQWGISLWELEVYGTPTSFQQAP